MTLDAYVATAVAGDADSWEEIMIVHPRTGKLLRADRDDLWTLTEEYVLAEGFPPFPVLGPSGTTPSLARAAARADVALCAAALPTGDGDEEEESPTEGQMVEGEK